MRSESWASEPIKLFSDFFTITGAGFMQGKENGTAAIGLKVPSSMNARGRTHPVAGVLHLIEVLFTLIRPWCE